MGEGYNKSALADYRKEIRSAYQQKIMIPEDVPAKGGKIGAAQKRYRASILLIILSDIKENDKVDMTPTLAKNLLKKTIGQAVSEKDLLLNFGKKGRDASKKSQDFERFDELVEKYKERLQLAVKEAKEVCSVARTVIKETVNL